MISKNNTRPKTPPHSDRPRTTDRRINPTYLGLVAVILGLALIVGFIFLLHYQTYAYVIYPGKGGGPAPVVWTVPQQPLKVENSAGVFALKDIDIVSGKAFHFYYVFKGTHHGDIQVTATSSLKGNVDIALPTTVQSLGTIDDYMVGIIHVQYRNRAHQAITLHITSPAEENASWHLTPLNQVQDEPHPEGGFYERYVDQQLLPTIIWSGFQTQPGQLREVAFFKNTSGTYYIFLEANYYQREAKVISQAECVRIAGKQACQ